MSKRLPPPTGHPPPEHAPVGGSRVATLPIAEDVAERFLARFPDALDAYEDPAVAREWCVHDTRHLIGWAAAEAAGRTPLATQLDWLGVVLESRGYPVQRLADTLELAAAAVSERHGEPARDLAEVLAAGAVHVRVRETFLGARDGRS